jgi:phage replication O-like protein O
MGSNPAHSGSRPDRFVRLPTALLEALLSSRLTGVQLRIVLWVIRNTVGWNRTQTLFSWYRIAHKIGGNRAVVWRAGRRLLQARVLCLEDGRLGIQDEHNLWRVSRLTPTGDVAQQRSMPVDDVAQEQRHPLPTSNAAVASGQRFRCLEATVLRRAKDRCKDKLKTYTKTSAAYVASRQRFRNGAINEHPAGAARPIPGKYDGISQD